MRCKVGQVTSYMRSPGGNVMEMDIKKDTGVFQKFMASVTPSKDKEGRYLFYGMPSDKPMNSKPFGDIWRFLTGSSTNYYYTTAGIYKYTRLPGVYALQFYGEYSRGGIREYYYIQENSPYWNIGELYTGMRGEVKKQSIILDKILR